MVDFELALLSNNSKDEDGDILFDEFLDVINNFSSLLSISFLISVILENSDTSNNSP